MHTHRRAPRAVGGQLSQWAASGQLCPTATLDHAAGTQLSAQRAHARLALGQRQSYELLAHARLASVLAQLAHARLALLVQVLVQARQLVRQLIHGIFVLLSRSWWREWRWRRMRQRTRWQRRRFAGAGGHCQTGDACRRWRRRRRQRGRCRRQRQCG